MGSDIESEGFAVATCSILEVFLIYNLRPLEAGGRSGKLAAMASSSMMVAPESVSTSPPIAITEATTTKPFNHSDLTLGEFELQDDYSYWKIAFLTWDIVSLIINGLGVDMLWHGVEVNHAVYALILQDVVIAWLSTFASLSTNWIFWNPDLFWMKYYCFVGLVPILFHNWSWAAVAYLRSINITNNEAWLELDQETLRMRISLVTWFTMFANVAALLPSLYFAVDNNKSYLSLFLLGVFLVFLTLSLSYVIALFFYLKILKHARQEAADFKAAVEAAAAAAAAPPPPAGNNKDGGNSASTSGLPNNLAGADVGNQQVNALFDDSEDDDLLDSTESPSAKQESAVYIALKTMAIMAFIQYACLAILTVTPESAWKYGLIAILVTFSRQPAILAVCVFNFGPIRNTVAIYLENLPDHILGWFEQFYDFLRSYRMSVNAGTDDQRSIVEASRDDLHERHSPQIHSRDGHRPQLVGGRRDSAVSPANSDASLSGDLPAVQC